VPAVLHQVIVRALEKDRSERYRNFAELLADVKQVLTTLKRQEEDALAAEALKQTDRSRWEEARRIARKLGEEDREKSRSPHKGGVGEQDTRRQKFPPRPQPRVRTQTASVTPALETLKSTPSRVAHQPTPQQAERIAYRAPGNGTARETRASAAVMGGGPEPLRKTARAVVADAVMSETQPTISRSPPKPPRSTTSAIVRRATVPKPLVRPERVGPP
jgi:hypothetical protein